MDRRSRAAASIAEAQAQLDRALAEIDGIREFDPQLVGLVAHALGNCITVTSATVDMLRITLSDYPGRDVRTWLDGIGRAADLMQHTVGRLVAAGPPRDFPLRAEHVNLVTMMERVCHYYRSRADVRQVLITCQSVGEIPPAWADRVVLAVVADNLVSHAVERAPVGSTILVQIMAEPGAVLCTVLDAGPALSEEEKNEYSRSRPVGQALDSARLAVARAFLGRIDGELWCESKGTHGASFTFKVPASRTAPPAEPPVVG
ncbi:MAG TPA: ATP-binding protein [Vicinamibacterales bacterium]